MVLSGFFALRCEYAQFGGVPSRPDLGCSLPSRHDSADVGGPAGFLCGTGGFSFCTGIVSAYPSSPLQPESSRRVRFFGLCELRCSTHEMARRSSSGSAGFLFRIFWQSPLPCVRMLSVELARRQPADRLQVV
jgi:hypothetical protein